MATFLNKGFSQDPNYNCVDNINTTNSTINIWNWQVDAFNDVYVKDEEGQSLHLNAPFPPSPYFETAANENVFPLANAPQTGDILDFQVNDGWELIQKQFGSQNAPVDVPYFIMYNKYKGILRVFMYVDRIDDYNSSYIQIEFDSQNSKESAILSHAKSKLWGLDKFEKGLSMQAINHYDSGDGRYWLYADFPMAYDPCTCGNYSYLSIKPFLINTINVDLAVNGNTQITPIIDQGTTKSNDSFTSTLSDLKKNSALSDGQKNYKTLGEFIKTTETIAGLLKVPPSNPTSQEMEADKKVPFKFPAAMNSIPKIGTVIGIMEFLINGGQTETKPKPHGFEANSKFSITGELEEYTGLTGGFLNVPGSDWAPVGVPTAFPVYDNILGVFNLLETPTIAIREVVVEGREDIETIDFYYKLNDNIKYVINPASGLSSTPLDMKGALFFEGCTSSSMISDKLVADHIGENGTNVYRTPYMSLDCLMDYVIDFKYTSAPICGNPDIYFKILVTLPKSGSNDLEDAVFIQFTYHTNSINVSTPLVHGFDDYKINDKIENITLTQNETVYVWERAILGDNINLNGYNLTVVAGTDIIVSDDIELTPNVTLKIEEPTTCSGVPLVQTTNQIKAFCGSSKYNPSKSAKVDNTPPIKPNPQFNVRVYPNPFSTSTSIEFTLVKEENVTLKLFNALGVEVESIMEQETLSAGEYKRVTRSDLPVGIYFAILQTDNGSQTIKIVKQ